MDWQKYLNLPRYNEKMILDRLQSMYTGLEDQPYANVHKPYLDEMKIALGQAELAAGVRYGTSLDDARGAAIRFADYHQKFMQGASERQEFVDLDTSNKEAEAKQKAEQEAQLEAQRIQTQRAQNYATNIGSGNLAGPGDQPTIIRGGSQNIDASRLDIGSSSTARRRRGRGISAQLGL